MFKFRKQKSITKIENLEQNSKFYLWDIKKTMLSQNYKIKISTETLDPTTSPEVVSIGVILDTSVLADSFDITFKKSPCT